MFGTNDFLIKTRKLNVIKMEDGTEYIISETRPNLKLLDGTELQILASKDHECFPRTDSATYYYSVEVGLIQLSVGTLNNSLFMERFKGYQKGNGGTYFSYVPVEELEDYINEIGLFLEKDNN